MLIQAGDAARLAGITSYQLREWCGRRAVIPADVEGQGPGRHALYSWQTLLTLRIINDLRDRYRIEIASWCDFARNFRSEIERHSFVHLWGASLWIRDRTQFEVVLSSARAPAAPGVLLTLDDHLEVLAMGLALPRSPDQLPLFPAMRHK
jgi:hypothetical protein